ncbi:hypothetical protein [Effusibacillus consociatus]|uniref:Uncharacterized protein n=1 Tax=Effusibacillus consociatus TaxID=1117041 RepID=A0ABV9Q5X2_9BACL
MGTTHYSQQQLLELIKERCDSFLEDIEYLGVNDQGYPLFSAFDAIHKREIIIRVVENRLEADYGYGYQTVITTIPVEE